MLEHKLEIKKIKFNTPGVNAGSLVFFEACKDIPFEIKRIYYLYNVPSGQSRGLHAHKNLRQVFICIHGSCTVMLTDGNTRIETKLSDPAEGLYVEKGLWREIYDFSPDAVMVVIASEYYDEDDYIREYDQYLSYTKEIRGDS